MQPAHSAGLDEAFDKLGELLTALASGSGASIAVESHLARFFQSYTALKTRLSEDELTVAVIAQVKSGEEAGFCVPG
jgi:hypothetical protein